MKKLFLFIIFSAYILAANAQTATMKGLVTDLTGKPLSGVSVKAGSNTVLSDASGKFNAPGIPYGKIEISFTLNGYETFTKKADINSPVADLGLIQLTYIGALRDTANRAGEDFTSGIAANQDVTDAGTATSVDIDDESKEQYVAGLLHSSNDVFVATSGYTLSTGYFRPRGYDNEYSEVLFNGLIMNDPETGRPNYSDWSGLNDATRYKESAYGLNPTRFSFGGIGGTTDIDARPSHHGKQFKVSYAYSNRTYRHRVMATYSTGLLKNGWSVMVSGSTRLGEKGFVEGTPYEGGSYFLSIEKKINKKHSIALTGFGAPTKKGMQSAAVQEIYDLLGNNYYNPNWGYQNGKVRSARIRNSHEPVIMLTHFYDINDKTKLTTGIGYSFGRTSTSALNWYNAPDPRPDYYRYLPGYQTDTATAYDVAQSWINNTNVSQINWDHIYQVNLLANQAGAQANYIIEDRRLDHSQIAISSHINREMSNHLFISGGLNVNIYKSRNYKVISDMLGGEYWLDIDQFAARDFPSDTSILQNDLNNPNRIVKKGDVYGYDYDVHINTANLWGLAEFTYNHLDFYIGLNVSGTQLWRVGNMMNGRFPANSYGKSDKNTFLNYAAKAGVTYKITGRHYLMLNTGYFNLAPNFGDVFQAPRINNLQVPDVKCKKVFSADLSYIIRTPRIKGRITAFETMFWDDTRVMSFYHDDLQTFVDYVVTGMNKVHQGIELGVEVKIIPSLFVVAAGSIGNYRYTNRPTAYTSIENGSQPDTSELVYAKNFYVSGTPQTAGSLGLKYQGPHYWYANLNANIFANNWIDFNPSRRTSSALDGLAPSDELVNTITVQHKAFDKAQFTLDVSLGKSFRIKNYFINLNASVTNLLNNTHLATTAFEQLRFDYETKDINKFPPKYYYAFGRTYFLMASFRF